jgi:hypothetical protein
MQQNELLFWAHYLLQFYFLRQEWVEINENTLLGVTADTPELCTHYTTSYKTDDKGETLIHTFTLVQISQSKY